ncbi:hypothetical protein [Methanospirillum lacunae]|uniref:Uncharacterized protein n=1 Tax=Methanospirillum lacunae TaxID=668570 RepID=A0A2V2N2A0_9EURY|nr:hypothetical protein [Methanospirillum lacunae]PWR72750.1 hypothetical protein DK846_07305 [Methanospirillum lacunae]
MKTKLVCIAIIVLGLLSSCVYGAELNISQGNIISKLPSPVESPSSSTITGSDYVNLKTIEIPSTPDSKTPVIRYTSDNLPPTINGLIDHIDFQTTKDKKGQVFIYFKLPAPDASVNQSREIGDFIINRKEWNGDRSLDSIQAEIYIHWVADSARPLLSTNPVNEQLYNQYVIGSSDKRPSPIYPTHLGYNYEGMDKTNLMDQFLLTL